MNTRFFLCLLPFVLFQAAFADEAIIAETSLDMTTTFSGSFIGQLVYPSVSSRSNSLTTFRLRGSATYPQQTIYVYRSPITTAPPSSSAGKLFAKTTTLDGISFIFDSSVKFQANLQYYFYFANSISVGGVGISGASAEARDNQQPYLVYDKSSASWQYQSTSLAFSLTDTPVLVEYTSGNTPTLFNGKFIGQLVVPIVSSPKNTVTTFRLRGGASNSVFGDATLYVLMNSPLRGPASSLPYSNYVAKAITVDGTSWTFPNSVQFAAGGRYYFYFSSALHGMIGTNAGQMTEDGNMMPMFQFSESGAWEGSQDLSLSFSLEYYSASSVSVPAGTMIDGNIPTTNGIMSFEDTYVAQIVKPAISSPESMATTFRIQGRVNIDTNIFVFVSPYTGKAKSLGTSSNYFAKSSTEDGSSWIFPTSVQFSAGKNYYFYFEGMMNADLGISLYGNQYDADTMANNAPYMTYSDATGSFVSAKSSLAYTLIATDAQPQQDVTTGAKQDLTTGAVKYESEQSVTTGAEKHESEQPVTTGANKYESEETVTTGATKSNSELTTGAMKESDAPVTTGAMKYESEETFTTGAAKPEFEEPVTTGMMKESDSSVTTGAKKYQSEESVTTGLAKNEPEQSVTTGAAKPEYEESITTGAMKESDAPVTTGAKKYESGESVTTGAAKSEPEGNVTTGAMKESDAPVTTGAKKYETEESVTTGGSSVTTGVTKDDGDATPFTTGNPIITVEITVTVITITLSDDNVDKTELTTSILTKLGLPESDAYRVKFVIKKDRRRESSVSFYIAPGINAGDKDASALTESLVTAIKSEPTALPGFKVTATVTAEKTETVSIRAGTTLTTNHVTSASMTTAAMTSGVMTKPEAKILASFTADESYTLSDNYIGQAVLMSASSDSNDQTTFTFPYKMEVYTKFRDQTMYVFDYPYTNDPKDLSKSDYMAKTTTKDGSSFTFSNTVQFNAGTKYFFYLGAPVTGIVGIVVNGKRGGTINPFIIYKDGAYEETSHNLALTITAAPDDGEGNGDPYFIGFNNQRFEFDGSAGRIYNIYNDPYMNLNSLFGVANSNTMDGTVMVAFGLSIGEHNITMSIDSPHNRRFFDLTIDGVKSQIGSEPTRLSGCVDIQYRKALLITTPKHDIYIYPNKGRHGHINVPYFNVHIHHPEEDESKIGGVLGQTAIKSNRISIEEQDFVVDSLYSFSASRFYELTTIEC